MGGKGLQCRRTLLAAVAVVLQIGMATQLRTGSGVEDRYATVWLSGVGFHRVVLELERRSGARQCIDEFGDASTVVVPAASVLVRTVAHDKRGGSVAVLHI